MSVVQGDLAGALKPIIAGRARILATYPSLENERKPNGNWRDPFTTGDLKKEALRLNREAAWWFHDFSHNLVHGNDLAHLVRTTTQDGGRIHGVHVENPELALNAVLFVTDSMIVSHWSISKLLALPYGSHITTLWEIIKSLNPGRHKE